MYLIEIAENTQVFDTTTTTTTTTTTNNNNNNNNNSNNNFAVPAYHRVTQKKMRTEG